MSITHLTFTPKYVRAIEHKQVAQQLAEQAKFVVAKNEQEKHTQNISNKTMFQFILGLTYLCLSNPNYLHVICT